MTKKIIQDHRQWLYSTGIHHFLLVVCIIHISSKKLCAM